IGGSVCAAFFQGVTLGGFIDGVHVVERTYAGGALEWLKPFSIFTGVGVVIAYALLGCTWLIFKTEGKLQQNMIRIARPLLLTVLAVIGLISLWTPISHPEIADRWFTLPNLFYFLPVPVLVLLATWAIWRLLGQQPHSGPFLLTLC